MMSPSADMSIGFMMSPPPSFHAYQQNTANAPPAPVAPRSAAAASVPALHSFPVGTHKLVRR
jgi:hypothetical protein